MPKQRADDAGRTSRRGFLAVAGTAAGLTTGAAGCLGLSGSGSGSMTVFHAGSLEPPFGRVESEFEDREGVDVTREARGSVDSTRKITEQGRSADVLGVSDYRLVRDVVLPEFGSWYAIFQTNAVTIHYTEDSTGAGDVSTDNWWEVLSRDGVSIGHSDPAADPGGYRAVMAQQLGTVPFEGSALYDDATYRALRDNSTVPTSTETKLVGQLQSGKLDYAFNYRSVGTTADVQFVELQPEVDLSRATAEYASHYAEAEVETTSGTYTGAPIAYGVTVPSVAESPDLGAKWVEFVLGDRGRTIQEETGFVPVDPAVVPADGESAVPDRVTSHAEAKESLGPLEL